MNLVIMGKSRCGKTTLTNMICKNFAGYSKISLDYLVMAFKKVFEDLNLEYYKNDQSKFTQFVETYFENCIYKDNNCGLYYVLEGADLPKETILKLKDMKNTKVIFLGKIKISQQEFFDEIRKYEQNLSTGGWTKMLDDHTLFSWCKNWIKESIKNKQFCDKNGIEFIDTSINQNQVLECFINKIKNN